MSPSYPVQYVSDSVVTHLKLTTYSSLPVANACKFANFSHLRRVQLRKSNLLSAMLSAFVQLIVNVISVCPNEQMSGANAKLYVTMMQHVKTRWNRFHKSPVSKLMSAYGFASASEVAVTAMVRLSIPNPTSVGFIHKSEESLGYVVITRASMARATNTACVVFGYNRVSHRLILLKQTIKLWSGSRIANTMFEPFLFYHRRLRAC